MPEERESEYPELLQNYLEFCRMRQKAVETKTIDLSELTWVYPITLLPLGSFILNNKDVMKTIPPQNKAVASYIEIMMADLPLAFSKGSSYIPLLRLPGDPDELDKALHRLFQAYSKDGSGKNAFTYVISELIDNIYQHSGFRTAFVMAQAYPKKNMMELCFFDDGISIPGSFEKHGMKNLDDTNAIVQAMNGLSTKDSERGRGLGDAMEILTKGFKGQALIISRTGAIYLEEGRVGGYILSLPNSLKGTLIGARIPFPSQEVNVYDYVG